MVPLSRPGDPKRKPAPSGSSTRSRIVIPLTSKPADYVPGSGPPLQPISLLPPGDSTAYIIERVLLPSPGLAPNGRPLPKRMAYLIGWRDLPAASKVVPAMQVLDYVSPRTLEDFEARLEQELDDEKGRLEAELKSDLVAPQAKKKKRGRPPAHSQIETAVVAEPETVAQAKSRHKAGVMSLTTPKKARLEEFEWLSDEEGSPSRQIAQEQFQSVHGFLPTEDDMSEDSESPPPSGPSAPMQNGSQADSIPARLGQPSAAPIQPSTLTRSESSADSSSGSQTPANRSPMPTSSIQRNDQGQQVLSLPPATQTETVHPQNLPVSEAGSIVESTLTKAKPKNSKKRPRPEEDSPPAQAEGETDWVVERIEDVEYYEVEGRGVVRYFKVSWEGDWPPDQKKTWEPEENIPPNLVRNFFKTSRNKRKSLAKSGPGSKQSSVKQTDVKNGVSKKSSHKQGPVMKQSRLSWPGVRRKYSSVSEAFAGDQDNLEMVDEAYDGKEDELNGDGQDEFFVVTEGGEGEMPSQSLWPTTAGALSTAFGVYRGFP
ncbi:hypothetical protein BBK36DRAFT_1116933 [Trichoderma citrinoviride]|uniref:Chromo domain-containing protein n=1 Tax=Trichoderma citrinoviride TaxID=58853 RepID=A0A2T4BBZ1_9HYPO|nr:hypothetical protein BBK36DRAFT_1116933 [Trichoderma citrinoviride]PTB66835.1 hypothetical protein BBK36DRAFT_1116933 [Trichoderma citrinoviride]